MSGRLPVFYSPRMVARPKTFSPSAAKPVAVVESWQRAGLPIDIVEPVPATVAQFKLGRHRRSATCHSLPSQLLFCCYSWRGTEGHGRRVQLDHRDDGASPSRRKQPPHLPDELPERQHLDLLVLQPPVAEVDHQAPVETDRLVERP